jgi:hypothetical protein
MVDSQTLGLVIVAVVLVVGVLAVFFYLSSRLKRRRDQILSELQDKPELVQDRAFNRLAMARREAALVGRTGTDISRPRELIAQSQAAFDLGQFPRAYELAQSAHEALVAARGRSTATGPIPGSHPPPTTPVRSASVSTAAPAVISSTAGVSSSAPVASPAAPIPRNRVESHFQLGLLETELDTARRDRPSAGPTLEATALRNQSQAAFDRGDFTESFRLALRARRALGGHIESLAASPSSARAAVSVPVPVDPQGVAEQTASAGRCPQCGYPTSTSDAFCRGCGTPREATTCPGCGAARTPSDTFCGRCGTRFSA